jgi:hypothetical protein
VRDLDNLNYRKMKKILMADASELDSQFGDSDRKYKTIAYFIFCY